MATTLTVNGTGYNQSQRKANSLLVDAWGWSLDSGYWLEFHEYQAKQTPRFTGPVAVSLNDGSLRFTGDIVSVEPGWIDDGRTWSYRCEGFEYRASQIAVTNSADGTGLIRYNLTLDDDDYVAANAGKSVGDILSAVFTAHSSALSAIGITTDATTASQFAARTLVPSDPVSIYGERFWPAITGFLARWDRNQRLIVLPSGLVRLIDVTGGSAHTLTAGTDPIDPPLFRRDWRHCGTRVQARGRGKIYPGYVSFVKTSLSKSWSGTDRTNWKWSDFAKPQGGYDSGTVNSVLSATSVRVTSSDTALALASNYWSTIQAWVYLTKSSGTGLTYTESRPITASTSFSAGGTCDLTLGYALDNAGASAYDSYVIIGKLGTGAASGLNNVYRLLDITDPGGQIANHLVRRFPVDVPFLSFNNASTVLTSVPMCQIIRNGVAYNATFKILPATGQVLFDRPYVEGLNSQAVLDVGGTGVVEPDDVYMLLAYSRGALTATYPPDSGGPVYSGTAYTAAGLQRTRPVDVDSYAYEGNTTLMVSFAQMIQESIRDTVIEGTVSYKGAYTTVYDPTGGHKLNIAGNGYTTGDESINIPVRAVTVRYQNEPSGVLYTTDMQCSTRRDPRTGESFFQSLSQLGSGRVVSSFNGFGLGQPSFDAMRAAAADQAASNSPVQAIIPPTSSADSGIDPNYGREGGSGIYRGRRKRRGLRPDKSPRRGAGGDDGGFTGQGGGGGFGDDYGAESFNDGGPSDMGGYGTGGLGGG